MEFKHQIEDSKGYFQLMEAGQRIAYMSYSRAGKSLIIIDHTDVKPTHKGQNLGRQLLDKAVDYARKEQIKIMPICPYAASVFMKDKSIRDVLK